MRKLFIGALILSGLGMMFTSCDNGLYDNNPKTDSSFIYNPENDANNLGTFIGTMKGTFRGKKTKDTNGVLINFFPSAYVESGTLRNLVGMKPEDTVNKFKLELVFLNFDGKKEYELDEFSSDPMIYLSYYDTSERRDVTYSLVTDRANAKIKVKGNEKNTMWGTFEGTLFRSYPAHDAKDSLVVKNGSFYVPKID